MMDPKLADLFEGIFERFQAHNKTVGTPPAYTYTLLHDPESLGGDPFMKGVCIDLEAEP